MLFVMRRQTFCRQERKIIKAHYMLAYECGLRRLRSRPRRPIGIAGVTKSIEARGVYLGLFTIKMFFIFLFYFLYFCLFLIGYQWNTIRAILFFFSINPHRCLFRVAVVFVECLLFGWCVPPTDDREKTETWPSCKKQDNSDYSQWIRKHHKRNRSYSLRLTMRILNSYSR